MNSLPAVYFDGRSARGVRVDVTCIDGQLHVEGPETRLTLPLSDVKLTPRLGQTRRRLEFVDGSACEVDDETILDHWFAGAQHRRGNLLAQLEAHRGAVAIALAAVALAIVTAALWGLPWIAERVALRLPHEWVVEIGRGALDGLDRLLGTGSEVPETRQQRLQRRFAELAGSMRPQPQLVFRTWPQLGANALALPDGTVVLTDAMVSLADNDNELLAVLAHELGHVYERHTLQRLLASAGIVGIAHVIAGDAAGLSSVVVAGPTILAHLHHTRALEVAADRFAFALMQEHGIDPVWFARVLRKLEAPLGEGASTERSWLRTHPPNEERAREAERLRWAEGP